MLASRQAQAPLLVYQVFDRVTARSAGERGALVGVRPGATPTVLRDWETLRAFNALEIGQATLAGLHPHGARLEAAVEQAQGIVEAHLDELHLSFVRPQVEFLGGVWFQAPGD